MIQVGELVGKNDPPVYSLRPIVEELVAFLRVSTAFRYSDPLKFLISYLLIFPLQNRLAQQFLDQEGFDNEAFLPADFKTFYGYLVRLDSAVRSDLRDSLPFVAEQLAALLVGRLRKGDDFTNILFTDPVTGKVFKGDPFVDDNLKITSLQEVDVVVSNTPRGMPSVVGECKKTVARYEKKLEGSQKFLTKLANRIEEDGVTKIDVFFFCPTDRARIFDQYEGRLERLRKISFLSLEEYDKPARVYL